jgi:hypothetical protein
MNREDLEFGLWRDGHGGVSKSLWEDDGALANTKVARQAILRGKWLSLRGKLREKFWSLRGKLSKPATANLEHLVP